MSFTGGELDERVLAKAALDAAEEQLQSLCASHAGIFVSVQRRGQALESSLQELLTSVKGVENQVVDAQQSLDQEQEGGGGGGGVDSSKESSGVVAVRDNNHDNSLAALSERHRVRRRTLLQHSTLLELLELPSLMDACVRSNLYEEALSIAAFANTLERRHTEKNVVVARVIGQIRSRQSDLRRHLLFRLKNHVTMPQCLEVVTALRRLNSIDLECTTTTTTTTPTTGGGVVGGGEDTIDRVHKSMELRLQIDFLEARDAWLESSASANPSRTTTTTSTSSTATSKMPVGSSEQLLDAIERYRTRMFEVATQYNAIFRAQTNAPEGSTSLLSMWTSRRVHSFLGMVSGQLQRMDDSAALRDALEASVFFSTSMGRLGADFTAQLPALFEPRMVVLVQQAWKDGPQQLEETLKVCRDAGVAAPLVSLNVVPPDGTTAGTDGTNTTTATATTSAIVEGQPMAPPRSLMALPPLARVVNAVLTGLNDLRRCLLPGIFSQLRLSLERTISEVRSVLSANEKAVNAATLRGEKRELREAASKMRITFKEIVEPYLRGSLEMALGNFTAAEEQYDILRKKEEEEKRQAEEAERAAKEEEEGKKEEGAEAKETAPAEGEAAVADEEKTGDGETAATGVDGAATEGEATPPAPAESTNEDADAADKAD